jgi:lysophospholipase L1-like esterase
MIRLVRRLGCCFLAAAAAAISPCLLRAAPAVQSTDTVAVIGDSITEQKQYSVFVEDYLLMCAPAQPSRVIQFGWGGETAEGFKNRMNNDCFRYHPTVATTCYGMNDGKYGPQTPQNHQWYYNNQKAVVRAMKQAGVRLIVIGSPGCVDVNTFGRGNRQAAETYNKTLADERDVAKQVAAEEGVVFADVYDPMFDVMTKAEQKYGSKYNVAGGDGVHPAGNGHLVMAYAFLKALGFDGNVGTITVDLASGKAEASEGHQVLSASSASIEVESARYPFCFYGDNLADPNSTRGILEFLPFNQDLNRFTLVVKGATGTTRVTWGGKSKDFDGEQLGKGVNLAAEFLDNPFTLAFSKVHQAVQKQQNFETPMIKSWVNSEPRFKQELPDDAKTLEMISTQMSGVDSDAYKRATVAVEPVKHTIKIEAVK